jgi:hypothetical protein
VRFLPEAGYFSYPDRIEIGNDRSMAPASLEERAGKQRMGEEIRKGNYALAKLIYEDFSRKMAIPYPESADAKNKNNIANEFCLAEDMKFFEKVDKDKNYDKIPYPAFDFISIHTHPSGNVVPSSGDLGYLYTQNFGEILCEELKRSTPNFIELIVGMTAKNELYNMLMIQEKTRPSREELRSLSRGFLLQTLSPEERLLEALQGNGEDSEETPEERLLRAIFNPARPHLEETPEERRIKEVYNILDAKYDPSQKRIIFGGSLKLFCETSYQSS